MSLALPLDLHFTPGQTQRLALDIVHRIRSPSKEVSVAACTLQQIALDKQLARVLAQLDKVHLDVPRMVRQNYLQQNLGSTMQARSRDQEMLACHKVCSTGAGRGEKKREREREHDLSTFSLPGIQ